MSLFGKSNYGLSACQNCGNAKSPTIINDDGMYCVVCRMSPHKGCGYRGTWHVEEAFAVGSWNTVRETAYNESLKPQEPELRPLNLHDKKQIRTYLDDRSFDGDTYIPDDKPEPVQSIDPDYVETVGKLIDLTGAAVSSLEQFKKAQKEDGAQ